MSLDLDAAAQKTAVLVNDTRVDRHHGCTLAVRALHKLAAEQGITITATAPAHKNWMENPVFMQSLANADCVIVNGEGTIHHDRPAGKWLLQAGKTAKNMDIPSLLCNATWDENGAEYGAMIKEFDMVSVRESQSQAQLAAIGVDACVTPDAALLFDWLQSQSRNGILVTDSVVKEASRNLLPLAHHIGATMIDIRHQAPDRVRDFKQLLDRKSPLNMANLRAALHAGRHGFGTQFEEPEDFIAQISGASLLVTGRFHAVILAMATRTPFLALRSNTHKIEATIADAGLAAWRCLPIEEIGAPDLERAAKWQEAEIPALENFIRTGRSQMQDVFKHFRRLIP